jgi:cysteine-rich repeat protein
MQLMPLLLAFILIFTNGVLSQNCSFWSMNSSPIDDISLCGDSSLDVTEECDDGNNSPHDGCSSNCAVEPGYMCCHNISGCTVIGCGDGEVAFQREECDDGNMVSLDGCSMNCKIEEGFSCTINSSHTSICFVKLLDLYTQTLQAETEDTFLVEPYSYAFELINNTLWDNITVVILVNPSGNGGETIQHALTQAVNEGRIPPGPSVVVNTEITSNDTLIASLEDLIGASIYEAELFEPINSHVNPPSTFINETLLSLRYNHPTIMTDNMFAPRNVCIIAQSDTYVSFECINITFIGANDNAPVVTVSSSPPAFIEGQSNPVAIINGSITITDPDHPMFLMKRAEVILLAADPVHETLYLNKTFDFVNSSYQTNGILTITGDATPAEYERVLQTVVYFNGDTEPQATTLKTITIRVSDGIRSDTDSIMLLLVNLNDIPTLVFSDSKLTTYYEGNTSVSVDSNVYLVDLDPNEMIQRIVIELVDPRNGNNEIIAISNSSGILLDSQQHRLELYGNAVPDVYSTILQTLTYLHNDYNPGNPTEGNRTLSFIMDDSETIKTQNFTFYLQPINDAPDLYFGENSSMATKTIRYFEDDPSLLLANDSNLRDVDSNIMSAAIQMTGLIDGANDVFYINQTLADTYNIHISITENRSTQSREITATGSATPYEYEQVLRTLSYENLFTNNSLSDGVRTVVMQVNDTYGDSSQLVTILLHANERNDEPTVQIDESLQFTEGSRSVRIVTTHLLKIIDEEMNNISSINITLTATNGDLDPSDNIFVRTPIYPLITRANLTNTSLILYADANVNEYEEVLRSILYINQEDEPTYYANATTREKLQREIIITLTDDNSTHPSTAIHRISINLVLINDNRPVITLKFSDPSCLATYPHSNMQRRSVQYPGKYGMVKNQKRFLLKRRNQRTLGLAPSLVNVCAELDALASNISCLSRITVSINANTTMPIIEVQRELREVLTFSPSGLNSIPHYGEWKNSKEFVIHFMGCYEKIDNNIQIIFEPQKNECNFTSSCVDGICFSNRTGCPIVGIYPVSITNATQAINTTQKTTPENVQLASIDYFTFYLMLCILALLPLVILVIAVRFAYCSESKTECPDVKGKETLKIIAMPAETLKAVNHLQPENTVMTTSAKDVTDVVPTRDQLAYCKKEEEDVITKNIKESSTPSKEEVKDRKINQTSKQTDSDAGTISDNHTHIVSKNDTLSTDSICEH